MCGGVETDRPSRPPGRASYPPPHCRQSAATWLWRRRGAGVPRRARRRRPRRRSRRTEASCAARSRRSGCSSSTGRPSARARRPHCGTRSRASSRSSSRRCRSPRPQVQPAHALHRTPLVGRPELFGAGGCLPIWHGMGGLMADASSSSGPARAPGANHRPARAAAAAGGGRDRRGRGHVPAMGPLGLLHVHDDRRPRIRLRLLRVCQAVPEPADGGPERARRASRTALTPKEPARRRRRSACTRRQRRGAGTAQMKCPIGHYKHRFCLRFRRVSWRV